MEQLNEIFKLVENRERIIKDAINRLEGLENCEGQNVCDLHNILFNEDQTYIYYADAEEALDSLGAFRCLRTVVDYEKENFGEVHTDIDEVKIANMSVYILGEIILNISEHYINMWNKYLTKKDISIIANELLAHIKRTGTSWINYEF